MKLQTRLLGLLRLDEQSQVKGPNRPRDYNAALTVRSLILQQELTIYSDSHPLSEGLLSERYQHFPSDHQRLKFGKTVTSSLQLSTY
jgi:hypothetical protein